MAARARKDADDATLSRQLAIRMSEADHARVEALVARFPVLKAATLARAAMMLGMEMIERQPTLLLGEKPHSKGMRKRRR